MLETYACEADLCEALGPAYPSSGVFDETVRDRQPKEDRWSTELPQTPADGEVWELTFRFLSNGAEGHVIARQLSARGNRTGQAVPMTGPVSNESGVRLRERMADGPEHDGTSMTAVPGEDLRRLRSWMHSTLLSETVPPGANRAAAAPFSRQQEPVADRRDEEQA